MKTIYNISLPGNVFYEDSGEAAALNFLSTIMTHC